MERVWRRLGEAVAGPGIITLQAATRPPLVAAADGLLSVASTHKTAAAVLIRHCDPCWYSGGMESALEAKAKQPNLPGGGKGLNSSTDVNWPTFFVVGAQKAGTTSLYVHLKRHPEVFLPADKELRIFQPEHRDSISLDAYRALYAGAKGYKAIGEVTPYYLADPLVPSRIGELRPEARIIIMLRDPVERAYSHYLNIRRYYWDSATSFREALVRYDNRSAQGWEYSRDYIEDGLYSAQVQRYFDTFGRDQVLVILFDDLSRNPNEVLARIARHIGVDPDFFAGVDVSEVPNPFHMPRGRAVSWLQRLDLTDRVIRWLPRSFKHAVLRPLFFKMKKPPLDQESRRRLQQFYEPDVRRLEDLLGRKLPELRKSWI